MWKKARLFVGVRNVNEDFFTSDVTSLFTGSSCGIFSYGFGWLSDFQLSFGGTDGVF